MKSQRGVCKDACCGEPINLVWVCCLPVENGVYLWVGVIWNVFWLQMPYSKWKTIVLLNKKHQMQYRMLFYVWWLVRWYRSFYFFIWKWNKKTVSVQIIYHHITRESHVSSWKHWIWIIYSSWSDVYLSSCQLSSMHLSTFIYIYHLYTYQPCIIYYYSFVHI